MIYRIMLLIVLPFYPLVVLMFYVAWNMTHPDSPMTIMEAARDTVSAWRELFQRKEKP